MFAPPVEQALGPARHGRILGRQDGRGGAHLVKGAQPPNRPLGRIERTFELDRKDRRFLPEPEKDVAIRNHVAGVFQRQPGQARPLRRLLDQGPPFPQHHAQGLGIGLLLRQPVGVVAKIARAVERIAGEDVLMSHAAL